MRQYFLCLFSLLFLFGCTSSKNEGNETVFSNDDLSLEQKIVSRETFKPTFIESFHVDANTIFQVSNNNSLPHDSVIITKMDGSGNQVSELKHGIGNGEIHQVFISDMDDDKNGEVIVWYKTNEMNISKIYAVEYVDESPKEINTSIFMEPYSALKNKFDKDSFSSKIYYLQREIGENSHPTSLEYYLKNDCFVRVTKKK